MVHTKAASEYSQAPRIANTEARLPKYKQCVQSFKKNYSLGYLAAYQLCNNTLLLSAYENFYAAVEAVMVRYRVMSRRGIP